MNDKGQDSAGDGGRRRRAAIALLFGVPFLLLITYMTGTIDVEPLQCFEVWVRWAGIPPEIPAVHALLQTTSFLLAFLSIFFVVLMTFIVMLGKTEGRGFRAGVMTASIFGILGGHIMLAPPIRPTEEWIWRAEEIRMHPLNAVPAPPPKEAPQPQSAPAAPNAAGV